MAVESIGFVLEGQRGFCLFSAWTSRVLMANLTLLGRCLDIAFLHLKLSTDKTTTLFLLLEPSCVYRIWQQYSVYERSSQNDYMIVKIVVTLYIVGKQHKHKKISIKLHTKVYFQ